MATAPIPFLPVEAYLRLTAGEKPAPEYVDGQILPRTMPGNKHSETQAALTAYFWNLRQTRTLYPRPELHMRVREGRVRIVDLAVFVGDGPNAPIPTNPPLIAIEILSPDDALTDLIDKLNDYQRWGVRHVWLAEPGHRKLFVWDGQSLVAVSAYAVPELEVSLSPDQVFGPADDVA